MNINKALDKTIKVLTVCIICIMLTIGFLFITPVYVHADSSSFYPFYTLYNYSANALTASDFANGLSLARSTDPISYYQFLCVTGVDNNVTNTKVFYSFYKEGTSTNLMIMSWVDPSSGVSTPNGFYYLTSNGQKWSANFNNTYLSDGTQVNAFKSYVFNVPVNDYNSQYVASFSSKDECINAFSEYIANGFPSSGGGSSSDYIDAYTDVKAGYVAYILVDEGSTIELTTQFPEFSRANSPYWDSVARYNEGLSDLPTEGTTYNDTTGFSINWEKLSTDTNAFGQSKSGYVIFTDISSGYFVVYNPTYRNVTSDGRQLISPTIRVWTSDTYGVAQFPINTRVSISSNGMTWLSTQTAGGYVATSEDYDPTTDTWSYHYPNSTQSAIIPNGGATLCPRI